MASWKDKMKEGLGTIAEAAKEAAQENLTKEKLTEFAGKAGEAAKDLANRGADFAKEMAERYEEAQEHAVTWVPGQMTTVANSGYTTTLHLVMMSIDEKHLMFTVDSRFIKKSTETISFKWLLDAEFGYTAMKATYDESTLHIEDDVSGETWANLRYVIPGECRPDGEPLEVADKFTVQIYAPFEIKRKEGFFKTSLEYSPPKEFLRFRDRFLDCWYKAREQEIQKKMDELTE